MAHSTHLPSILIPTDGSSAISMERALKQALELLKCLPVRDDSFEDRVNATHDDLEVMLKHIDRN